MSTRILIVDDELDTLSLLRTILEISGFQPITTLNSVDAIGLAEMEKPDVVLLDIMMPKLDGFTLCKMMRDNLATSNLPIIFVTAYEALDIEERRIEAGADLLIQKPIDVDALVTAIHEATKMRAAAMMVKKKGDPPAAKESKAEAGVPSPVGQQSPDEKEKPSPHPDAVQTQEASQVERNAEKPDSKA